MSMPEKRKVKCPDCGKEIEFTLWNSINTEMPFAVKDIISGKLFEIECKNCGFKTHVNYPMLFNDMLHHTMIYYTLPDNVEEVEKSMDFIAKMGSKCRIVTSQSALKEKVMILNADLDDRIVEILKLFTINGIQEKLEGYTLNGVYLNMNDSEMWFELDLGMKDKHAAIDTSMEAYKFVKEEFGREINTRCANDRHIDADWALKFMESLDEER